MTISIRNWNDHFEISQSRKLRGRDVKWTPMPTKHDGKTLRKILRREDGGDIFAAFILMVEVAAKCPVRGVLADEDRDLTAEDLSLKTGFGEKQFENAIAVLSGCDYRWLDDSGSMLPACSQTAPTVLPLEERRGEERRGEKIKPRSKQRDVYPSEFEELWEAYGKKGAKRASLREWESIGPSIQTPDGWDWMKLLILRAVIYRSIVPWEEFKHTKDLERWLKSGSYDFDMRALCKQWGVTKRVDARSVWNRYLKKKTEEAKP